MSRLPDPLLPGLEEPTTEGQISRVWGHIDARRGRRRSKTGFYVGGGLLVAAAAALLVAVLPLPSEPSALLRSDGAAVATVSVPPSAEAPELLSLDDGSEVTVEPGAELSPGPNGADHFHLVLARGRARFSVEPEGPRRWTIDSGLATIEVVGTVFSIDRGESRVLVHVERGVVLVRGEAVPGGVQRLTAGDSLTVEGPPLERGVLAAAPGGAADPLATDIVLEEPPAEPVAETSGRRARPTRAHDRGAHDRGAHEDTADEPDCQAEVLLAEADRARRDGHRGEALALLERASRASSDSHGALAAFTRARMLLDELDRPVDARVDFERALAIGLSPRLAETARYRLVECHARGGDRARASASARRYLARHPEGAHADGARRWLDL